MGARIVGRLPPITEASFMTLPDSAASRRQDGRTPRAATSAAICSASPHSNALRRTLAPEFKLLWETASLGADATEVRCR